jgi:hypothetical protein
VEAYTKTRWDLEWYVESCPFIIQCNVVYSFDLVKAYLPAKQKLFSLLSFLLSFVNSIKGLSGHVTELDLIECKHKASSSNM